MKNVKIILIDDESLARDVIKYYLKDIPETDIVAECEDGFEGARAIRNLKPDLVFLDIQMPRIDGFEMIELLDELPMIIFATAYDEFAIKAFEINAIDYLLKPFTRQRFQQAYQKAIAQLEQGIQANEKLRSAVDELNIHRPFLDRIMVRDSGSVILLNASDILYLEAADDYVSLYTQGKRYMQQKTLSWYEARMNRNFLRVHRSYMLNTSHLLHIEPYGKETWVGILKNHSARIPISRTGHKALMAKLSGD
jgi:two-component system LytT family response regulator